MKMKHLMFASICMVMACNSSQKTVSEDKKEVVKEVDVVTLASTITEEELKEHLYTYASDEFAGRETGSPGQKMASAYLKSEYENLGIPAAKSDGDYYQKVPLEIMKPPAGSIKLNGKEYSMGENFLSFSKISGSFDEIVYLAFGIEQGEYSDYEGMDVSGKVILVKSGEPLNQDGTYKLSGTTSKSEWSNKSEEIGKKGRLATSKGARGMLFYDPVDFPKFKRYFDYLKRRGSGQMTLASEDENHIEAYINGEMAKILLLDIDTNNSPTTLPIKFEGNVEVANDAVDSENVAAIIKGSEKPDEYVVISSHLDHIGITADGQINNGADDDGSGSVALLEIAEAFKEAVDNGHAPKRSVVFLHVTGEEKGLLGSKYYTDSNPIFPLANTVANLNIDMIGRIDPKRKGDRNYIYLIGSDKLSSELHDLSEEVNSKYVNIELDYTYNDENDPNRFYYRSDHYNFAKNNIPIIFYFNGTHEDYHRPGDTADKINYDLLENRTRLIFHTAWEVANRDKKIAVDNAAR